MGGDAWVASEEADINAIALVVQVHDVHGNRS